jgi:hypothetical protein
MAADEVRAMLALFKREFGNVLNAPVLKVATISAFAAGVATITWAIADDDPNPPDPVPGVPWLSSYSPAVGDKVYLLVAAGSPVIIGSIAGASAFPTVPLTYTDLAGTTDFSSASYTSFTGIVCTLNKLSPVTSILVRVSGTGTIITAANNAMSFAALVNGVDTEIGQWFGNVTGDRKPFSVENKVAPALAPGSYTVQFRVKRTSGTGAMRFDANDYVSISAQEVM